MKILLVDDEPSLLKGLSRTLTREGYTVVTAADGKRAMECFTQDSFDLIVLDLMLPEMDGFTVCQRIRASSDVPIIMLTAKAEDVDKIVGLELGADDYMTKPFNTRELLARMRAVLRRGERTKPSQEPKRSVEVGPLVIDTDARRVFKGGHEVSLTAREFELLSCLARHPNRVFTRDQLLETVWGYEYLGDSRAVDVQMSRLRQKLEDDPMSPVLLRTKWGVGYYLTDETAPTM